MKIPFDVKFRPQIESGEYKVILDCGVEAEILAWDKSGDHPIVCMARKDGAIPFRVDNNGKAYHFPEGANYSDLFIVTPEEELTEWQKFISACLQKHGLLDCGSADRIAKESAAELLSLAREQFIKDGYVIEKKAFHDAVDKIDPELMKGVSANIDFENLIHDLSDFEIRLLDWLSDDTGGEISIERMKEVVRNRAAELLVIAKREIEIEGQTSMPQYFRGYEAGKKCAREELLDDAIEEAFLQGKREGRTEALKDLPRWRHAFTTCSVGKERPKNPEYSYYSSNDKAFIVLLENSNEAKCLMLDDLKKLPGFKED